MDTKKRHQINKIRFEHTHSDEFDDATKRNLIFANKSRVASQLYKEGIEWFKSGKDLEEATKLVDFFEEQKQLKDIVYFQRGFQEGLMQLGFEFGYNKRDLRYIFGKNADNKYFLIGYKKGIEKKEREEEKEEERGKKFRK